MSCITEILNMKGDAPIMAFPQNSKVVIEGGGEYKGYEFLITFTDLGHRCGYVAINPSHPVYGKDQVSPCEKDDFDLCVHGGITFHQEEHGIKEILKHPCKDEWLGFDAAHGGDAGCPDTVEKYFGKTEFVSYMKNNAFYTVEMELMGMKHRTFDYMRQECFNLIDQLIEIENRAQ